MKKLVGYITVLVVVCLTTLMPLVSAYADLSTNDSPTTTSGCLEIDNYIEWTKLLECEDESTISKYGDVVNPAYVMDYSTFLYTFSSLDSASITLIDLNNNDDDIGEATLRCVSCILALEYGMPSIYSDAEQQQMKTKVLELLVSSMEKSLNNIDKLIGGDYTLIHRGKYLFVFAYIKNSNTIAMLGVAE